MEAAGERQRQKQKEAGGERERQGETDGERELRGNLLTQRSAFLLQVGKGLKSPHWAFRGQEARLPSDLTVRQWVVWSGQVKWHKQRLEVNPQRPFHLFALADHCRNLGQPEIGQGNLANTFSNPGLLLAAAPSQTPQGLRSWISY